MKTKLAFDFNIDKANKKVLVNREFNAGIEKVWKAWTMAEFLNKWWAPKPYVVKTKSMDFKVGGRWFYAMAGPEGDEHYCIADYKSIEPVKSYSYLDAFCDANQVLDASFPRSFWNVSFSEKNGITMVHIEITHERLEDLEKIIELGFKEGFTMAMTNLDEIL